MPYIVQMEIQDSPIEGKGVFALEDIPQGATIWKFQTDQVIPKLVGFEPSPNVVLSKTQLQEIEVNGGTEYLIGLFKEATYFDGEDVILDYRDGTQFTNHSTSPNTRAIKPASKKHTDIHTIALRPIKKGEEIFENYNEYSNNPQCEEPKWFRDFIQKYYPQRIQLTNILLEELQKNQSTETAI